MKKIFFILTILSFITIKFVAAQNTDNGQAYAAVCENQKISPDLIFYTSYGKLKYDNSYSREELTQLGSKFGMFEEGDLASGLALVDVAAEYELNTSGRKMTNNGACIIPQELSVYIGFQNPVIYLAKDLQPETCLYNLVLRHEQVHQQINVNALEYFIPLLYERIKQITAQMKPMYISDVKRLKEGTNEMTSFYAKQINLLIEEFKQEILIEQRKLDNRQQYKLESNICKIFNQKNLK